VEEDAPATKVSGDLWGGGRSLATQELNSAIWGLDRIDADQGLDQTYDNQGLTGNGVHVYITDTGIRTTHSDFGGRAIPTLEALGEGVVECNGDPNGDPNCAVDRDGHGTHCAGIVGGSLFGVAKEATLHAAKVLDDLGSGSFAFLAQAIDFIVTQGERPAVISASLGGRGTLRFVNNLINQAVASGVTVVVAAGNEGDSAVPDACEYTPAGVPAAITVGSIGDLRFNDRRSSFSNIGPCVDVFAPGGQIPSEGILSDDDIDFLSGTSMACPHVAGAVALLLGQDSSRTPTQVVNLIQSQAATNKIFDVGLGSPNRLLNIENFDAAPTPAPAVVADVEAFTEISDGTCADIGEFAITLKSTCEAAVNALGKGSIIAQATSSPIVPEGCFLEGDQLFLGFSPSSRGIASSPAVRQVCTSLAPRFQQIASGTCADIGLSPIVFETACDDARRAIGVETSVTQTDFLGAPEGCFIFAGTQAFFSVNPLNDGNGVSLVAGDPLTPICMSFQDAAQEDELTAGALRFHRGWCIHCFLALYLGALVCSVDAQDLDFLTN
jgi:hypothetical protein